MHTRRDGSPFHVEVRRTVLTYKGRPCLLSVVRDVSQRVQAEEFLLQQAEARQREQATLLDISHTLASTLELKPDLILDQLGVIVQYSRAVLFVIDELRPGSCRHARHPGSRGWSALPDPDG